jgi:hypothetical protein
MVRKLSEAMAEGAGANVDPLIIQSCMAEYDDLSGQAGRIAQRIAAMFTRYEKQGVNVKSVKASRRASKMDRAAARAQAQSDIRYLIIGGVLTPANDDWARQVSQSNLFADEKDLANATTTSPNLARARAHSDGYNSGRHGGAAINNPFQPGSETYAAWEEGRKDGLVDKGLRASANGKTANTTSRGPGRPKGTKNKRANGDAANAA